MRIAFMGTPEFAVPTLDALIASDHDVVAVYSQPPARAGRGKRERKSPVHARADAAGIPVYTPKSMKDADAQAAFKAHDLDVAVVVAYGQILPQALLDTPKHGCVNVHASLLPRWRGAAPIHRAVMAGDSETGVCIMQMEAGLDTGPVLMRAKTPISDTDTTSTLHDQLAAMGADLIVEAVEGLADGSLRAETQSENGITYAHKIDKAEARIHWGKSAVEVDRQVRGLMPFPGAWAELGGERIKILGGDIEPLPRGTSGLPGETLDDQMLVACGSGAYRVERAQRAGKGAMDRADFLRGFPVPKATRFN